MNDRAFAEGDLVTIVSLGKDGVVDEVLSGDKFRVAVGSMRLTCSSADLSRAKPPPPKPRLSEQKVRIKNQPKPPQALDLHGLTVDEAIRKLDAWLDAVILSDLYHVKVIHGLGTGRVQWAVHEHLRGIKAVKSFKINEWNPGETEVYLG